MTMPTKRRKPVAVAEAADDEGAEAEGDHAERGNIEPGVDDALVEQAVVDIKAILGRTYVSAMVEVGAYLLKHFYDDKPELYLKNDPTKVASLKRLLEHCDDYDFSVKRTFLSDSLRIAAIGKQLGRKSDFHRLLPSHRVALVRLPDATTINSLARVVVEEELTVAETRERVDAELAKTKASRSKQLRPSLVVRELGRFASLLVNDDDSNLSTELVGRVERMTVEQRKEARKSLRTINNRLAKLTELLKEE